MLHADSPAHGVRATTLRRQENAGSLILSRMPVRPKPEYIIQPSDSRRFLRLDHLSRLAMAIHRKLDQAIHQLR